ncbi:MAG: S1C family serine protease [Candidatus Omnitrophota bacterium]
MSDFKRVLKSKKMLTVLVMVVGLLMVAGTALLKAEKNVETVEKVEKAEKHVSSQQGFLGIATQSLTSEDKREAGVTFGIQVVKVTKGEAADKSGIKKYDVIQYFNDEKIRDPEDLVEAVRACKPGSTVKVKLFRDGKEKEMNVTVGTYKEEDEMEGEDEDERNMSRDRRSMMRDRDMMMRDRDMMGQGMMMGDGSPYLGVSLQDMNKDMAEYFGVKENEGALILSVDEDSPAQDAGFKSGDVIVKVDGRAISKSRDVVRAISRMERGDKVDIDIIRHHKKMTLKAKLERRRGSGNLNFFRRFGDNFENFQIPFMGADAKVLRFNSDELRDPAMQQRIRERISREMKRLKPELEKMKKEIKKDVKHIKVIIKNDNEMI